MGVTAAIAIATTAVAGSAYQASEANKARKKADEQANAMNAEQERLRKEAEARMANEESAANESEVQRKARERQKRVSAAATGRRGTILTSPLGIQGGGYGNTGAKTILGA